MPTPPSQHLLVFAHTPPPVHGQSLMVQTLVNSLPEFAPHLTLHHVNPRLSRDSADIGRWRPAKVFSLLAACLHALRLRFRYGPMPLYYVPAPAKRGALYRDWLVMLLCRPFFNTLILHWHAVGLGEWLIQHATAPERSLTHLLLGRANLSIVLAPELLADAQHLHPRRTAIVPNGLDLPARPKTQNSKPKTEAKIEHLGRTDVLYLGLCSREKGLFDLLTAIAIANRREPDAFRLTVAGSFASIPEQHAFFSQVVALGTDIVRHVGFADAAQKQELFASADLFCFPTHYPHEAQPLTLIEALAGDLPIIATRWRGIPSMLPAPPHPHIHLVEPSRPDQLAEALLSARSAPPANGELRAHYLAHFTGERHLAALATAISSITPNAVPTPP